MAEARQLAVDGHKGAELPPAEVSEKIITAGGHPLTLNIVRPLSTKEGVSGELPALMFFHGGGWIPGDFPNPRAPGA